ncbi:hypothetical protein D3C71_20750 [compost metagenome]
MAKHELESERRQLTVSPAIIMSLIKAQAGTLAKGLLECVMNSIDAGATRMDITLTATTLKVVDNGKGFASREEILACFEVFGFEHKEGDRKFGSFGLGRAQLWNFVSTVWHSNQFQLDVDIRERGLDYDLISGVSPAVDGLTIEGKFYEPQKSTDILAIVRELTELAPYVEIPVFVNGECITRDTKAMKWTHETDDAFIQLNQNSRSLVVYNLGAKVREYPSHHFGIGGVVVTKPGVRMKLNIARNDIILSDCAVWKRIRPFLQAVSDKAARSGSTRLTEDQLSNLATRFFDGDLGYDDVSSQKLVVDVQGNRHTLWDFLSKARKTVGQTVTYVRKVDAGPLAERSHKERHCFVLDQKTLLRFGSRTLTEFMTRLQAAFARERHVASHGQSNLTVVENWRDACKRLGEAHTEIPHKEWTKREQAAMSALRRVNNAVLAVMRQAGASDDTERERELRIGLSQTANAWTDGKRVIWLNRECLAKLEDGMSGAMYITNVLVHEYLHDDSSTGSHVHDEQFHERFHRALVHSPNSGWKTTVGDCVQWLLARYLAECSSRDVPIKAKVTKAIGLAESFAIEDPALSEADATA